MMQRFSKLTNMAKYHCLFWKCGFDRIVAVLYVLYSARCKFKCVTSVPCAPSCISAGVLLVSWFCPPC